MMPFVWKRCHEMHLRQGQRRGAVTLLIAAVLVYALIYLNDRRAKPEPMLAWIDQGPGVMAVEISDSKGPQGIYFLPAAKALQHIDEITGNKMQADSPDLPADGATASTYHGVLKFTDMPVVKRLALGLPVDVNRATEGELAMVPGIGERTAAMIVQMRQEKGEFSELADLMSIPGIKDGKLRELKRYLTAGPNL
jgi:competence ComEA-like helix-hairpin-helix protein